MFKRLINFIKYKLLHLRPPLPEYNWNTIGIDLEEKDMSGVSARCLGETSLKQMRELNYTLKLLKNKIKRKLPDYLKENLDDIQINGEINHINLQFHFKNYNKMNKKLVNEIRSDFASCIQTDKLPGYKIKFEDTEFTLIFYIEDYL